MKKEFVVLSVICAVTFFTGGEVLQGSGVHISFIGEANGFGLGARMRVQAERRRQIDERNHLCYNCHITKIGAATCIVCHIPIAVLP